MRIDWLPYSAAALVLGATALAVGALILPSSNEAASTLQLGLGMAGLFAGVGLTFVIAGLGLVWAARPEKVKVPALQPVATPA